MRGVNLGGKYGRAVVALGVAAALVWAAGCSGGGAPVGSLPAAGTTTPAGMGTPGGAGPAGAGGMTVGPNGQPMPMGGQQATAAGGGVPGPVAVGPAAPAGAAAATSAAAGTAPASAASAGPPATVSAAAAGSKLTGKVFAEDDGGNKLGVGGVTVSFSVVTGTGTAPVAVRTAADGSWTQSGFAAGATYRVTPARSAEGTSWHFTPAYRDLAAGSGAASFLERPRRLAFGTYAGHPIMWQVKTGYWGPGPNNWSDLPANVWVDDQGRLHLKITEVGGKWYCAEVVSEKSFGYKDYSFHLATRYDQLDPQVTAGLFTYLDDAHELDVELSRWGDPTAPDSQFVVQPYQLANHLHRFNSGLTEPYTTQAISWRAGKVSFSSIQNAIPGTMMPDRIIDQWTYAGTDVPTPSTEKLHLNLWLKAAAPAKATAGRELVVTGVEVE